MSENEMFDELTKKAEQGDVNVQFNLGDMYYFGEGVEQDYEKAFKWFSKAAEQGSSDAQYNLGVIYYNGQCISLDYKKAFEWFSKAAEKGLSDAQTNLGVMYANGQGVVQDYEKAFEWFLKAAEQGNASAQNNIGKMYLQGEGIDQNYKNSFEWFTKSAEQNNLTAQFNIGLIYFYGIGMVQNFEKAFECFTRAANQGNADAQRYLGHMYYFGKGIEQDYKKAFDWYTKASEQGNSEAQYRLGVMYYYGKGVEKNYTKTFYWYTKAANQNNDSAQKELGDMYYHGNGVNKDYEKAFSWYKKAAHSGNARAQAKLGRIYFCGEHTRVMHSEAFKWWSYAAEQNEKDALLFLSCMYKNGDGVKKNEEKSKDLLKKLLSENEILNKKIIYDWIDIYYKNRNKNQVKEVDIPNIDKKQIENDTVIDNRYLIKEVKIVPGNIINQGWQRDMQIVYTDKLDYIDNIPKFGGHDWGQDIGKIIEAKIKDFVGYYWIKFLKYIDEFPKNKTEEELPLDYDINQNQELLKIYEYIKQDIPIMFLTGGAGTGKSTFIKYLKNNLKYELNKTCIVLAPTGVASINVGGQTIHSFFGFKTDIFENKEINRLQRNSVIDHTDLIIIDEVSMVSSWMLDHIDYALRLWCDADKPFGGKQMLFIGDCFQLPPIAENDRVKQKFFEKWDNSFFFAAKVFETIEMKAVQLKKIYRQKNDKTFIHMLNRIRKCQNGYEKDIEFLNKNCFIETRLGTKNVPEECLLLTTKNAYAEKFNTLRMNNLQQRGAMTKTFYGQIAGKFNFEHFLTPKILDLCIGARIMITKNISSQNLANGDMGKVVDFGTDYVDIETKGNRYRLYREKWQSLRYSWDEQTKSIQQIEEGSFSQIPLKLGWAVTIHKSQGLTLDAVAIDAADAWDSGQVYVALSRARNLSGILLKQKIPVSAVKSNPYIKGVYQKLFPESEKDDLYIGNEYENINLDNSSFTIDESKEITSVNIGGIEIELYPHGKIQDHVKNVLSKLLKNNLIPEPEMKRLLTDKKYCYEMFGIVGITSAKIRYTLLSKNKESFYDEYYDQYKCWKESYCGYYICSQWYQSLASNFAKWLVALSKGQLNSYLQPTELMKSNFDYGLGIDWAKKRREDFENNSMALIQQQKEIRFEQFCRQNKIANVVLSNAISDISQNTISSSKNALPDFIDNNSKNEIIKSIHEIESDTLQNKIQPSKNSPFDFIDNSPKYDIIKTVQEIKPIEVFIAKRLPTMINGHFQFCKEDGISIIVDKENMKSTNLPWSNKSIEFKVYAKENGKITEWDWSNI